ncbi:hypothetical protein C5167_033659 [Papaver somniferum]|uniref:Uncharacterized protein n=1 Tax=Papaver somniferum TaxID=3469 RepID=A0A4Y7K6B4_PAPSO|nr:hypothetical protein C5167_033659 [Papaver somniferum]
MTADLLYERKGGAISTAAVHTIREIDGEMPDVTCHSYNWKNKSFNEIQITGIPSSVPGFSCDSRVATFAESLLPVQKQTTSSSHRKFITTFQFTSHRAGLRSSWKIQLKTPVLSWCDKLLQRPVTWHGMVIAAGANPVPITHCVAKTRKALISELKLMSNEVEDS